MSAKKIVVDTNVIVSALLGSSYPKKIIAGWLSGQIHVVVDEQLRAELNAVLGRPKVKKALKSKSSSAVKVVVGALLNLAEWIEPKAIPIRVFTDENDHFLLELAVGAKAAAIVTGDQEILKSKKVRGIVVLDPKTFCERFGID